MEVRIRDETKKLVLTTGMFSLRKRDFSPGKRDSSPPNIKILGWCPVGPVMPHGEKVPL